ncbi:MAG: alpha/beta hydrolase-fold protein [Elusimicrobia bacterium]|nr:alpha/beta hydrolase-fold protein [Elusimicrobiota bacterium]
MQVNYHKFFSARLGQNFEFKAYGTAGKPVMVFPTSCGRFFDYAERGMIEAMAEFIERGEIIVFTVDGRDWESWYKPVQDKWIGIRHSQYEDCIIEEVIPFISRTYNTDEKFLATGNSMGAFHAANFFLKFPRCFDCAVCLSGIYTLRSELHGYYDTGIYFNEPLSYMPGLKDENILSKLREGYIVITHGYGAWEIFNDQAKELSRILKDKNIPCWYDPWGERWPHDWETWLAQIKKYMADFKAGVLFKEGTLKLTGPDRRINKIEYKREV